MKKSLIVVAVVIGLMVLLVDSGAAQPTGPITLRAHFWFPNTSNVGLYIERMLNLAEKKTGGKVKFKRTWAGSLVQQRTTLQALDQDIADVSYVDTTAYPGELPRTFISSQYGPFRQTWAGLMAWTEWTKLQAIKSEWEKWNAMPIWPACFPPNTILSTKPVPNIDAIKGMRFVSRGGQAIILRNLGGSPAPIQTVEVYEALSKGTVDAVWFSINFVPNWRWQEVIKYWVPESNIGGAVYSLAWNKRTFDSLPRDIQDIILGMDKEAADIYYEEVCIKAIPQIVQKVFPEARVKVIHWSERDVKKLFEVGVNPAAEEWLKEMGSKGFTDIRDLYQKWVDLNKKYEAKLPAKAKEMGWTYLPD